MLPLTEDVEIEICHDKFCQDYRGRQSITRKGLTCQAWEAQEPHSHTRTADKHIGDGLEANYCRNPTDAKVDESVWCYTTDPETRWDYCDPI